jgi:hypothetical protein
MACGAYLETEEGHLTATGADGASESSAPRLSCGRQGDPSIEAREDPAGPHQVCVHVRVALPWLGPVLTYDGTIDIEDTRA